MFRGSGKENRREELADGLLRELASGREAGEARARPGFMEASQARIQERLARESEPKRSEARRSLAAPRRVRWAVLVPAATLALMMLFTTGAFAFSRNAAPDSYLYGTKLFFERTRMALTGTSEARVDYQVELVDKRLAELKGLVSRGEQRGGARWEAAYRDNVDRLYAEIVKLPEDRQAEMLRYAAGLLEEQAEAMSEISADAPQGLGCNIDGALACGAGAMERMRLQCGERCEEGAGNGGGSGSGEGGCGGSGSGNGSGNGSGSGNGGGSGNGSGNGYGKN